ncbi:hypothetical protein C8J56DRAFT_768822 [Mycena floridula]|nr:hypothetical protein C8J56DRAFT_768822 [Mycena floridula]
MLLLLAFFSTIVIHSFGQQVIDRRATASAIPFSPGFDISKVVDKAKSLASHSWEFGTAAEALLEFYNPELSVFGSTPFPVPTKTPSSVIALSYAANKITFGKNGLSNGEGAPGDQASLGISAVMLGKTNKAYGTAAAKQVAFLVNNMPRFSNKAISQRADVPELWSDFMYMVPPFMAFYAADVGDWTLLNDTVNQCTYYRQVLKSNTTAGVWEHIVGPQSPEPGLWASGNGWVAAGMVRILAVVLKAPVSTSHSNWKSIATARLTLYIKEIIDGVMAIPLDGGLVRNYMDAPTSPNGYGRFGETSGSSLLASVVYRMAVLAPATFGSRYILWADGIRKVLGGNDSAGKPHVASNGVVTPTVNPLVWQDYIPYTKGSPEGQNFVVLMYAAWRDCVDAKKCSK